MSELLSIWKVSTSFSQKISMYIFQIEVFHKTILPDVFTIPFLSLLWSAFALFFFFHPYPFILWFVISLFLKVLIPHIVNLSLFVQAPCAGRPWTLWSPVGITICIANDWWWQNVMSYWLSFSNCEMLMRELRGNMFQLKRKKKNLKIVLQRCSYCLITESPNLGRADKHRLYSEVNFTLQSLATGQSILISL